MQTYFSTYLSKPDLQYHSTCLPVLSPKGHLYAGGCFIIGGILFLLPLIMHSAAGLKISVKIYWRSLDDMTGYYMDSLRGLTTLKLFDRDKEHSHILGKKQIY